MAVILILMSHRAAASGQAFTAGWLAGVTAVTVAALLVTDASSGSKPSSRSTGSAVAQLVLGVAFLALAVVQWRMHGGNGVPPKWMTALERVTQPKAAGLGLLLAAANPKNLLLSVSAGVAIGEGALSAGGDAIAVAIFVLLGSVTIAGPTGYYLANSARARVTLQSWRSWLGTHNAAVLAVLFLVIGMLQLGKAVAGLS